MKKLILALAFLLPIVLAAAISVAVVWEVREAGSDTNGGGFKAGATGTDMSIFNNKNLGACTNCQSDTVNISTTDAATTTTTTLTSATANFSAAIVGNIIYLTIGGGSCNSGTVNAQRREVTARTNVTTITLDATPTGSGDTCTGVTMNIGGALQTLGELASARGMVASNKAFVTSLTTTLPTVVTFGQTGVTPTNAVTASWIEGYTGARGDGGKASVTFDAASANISLSFSNSGWVVQNLDVNCSSVSVASGIKVSTFSTVARNKVSNCTSYGIYTGTYSAVYSNEVASTTSAASASIYHSGYGFVVDNYVHDGAAPGVVLAGFASAAVGNVIVNNSGASSYGISATYQDLIYGNTISGSGSHGIYRATTNDYGNLTINNVIANSGTSGTVYGIQGNSTGAVAAQPVFDGNCFYNNLSGARNNMDDTTGIRGVGPYTNVFDKLVTAGDIFTNAVGGDWSLNATANRGVLCRSAAVPATWPGLATTTNYGDLGAVRHQDPAPGGGGTKAFPWVQ